VTYLKVIEGRARYDGRASLKTWLFAVIRRTAAERRRRAWLRRLLLGRRPDEVEPAAPPSSEQQAADGERRRAVLTALAELPTRQREVLDLVFYHDLTIEEAARVMGVALGTARLHYARGKERLLARVAPEGTP